MATITIRNLPDPVRDRLRLRAAKRGRSMEAEAREVLAQAVAPDSASTTAAEVAARMRRAQAIIRARIDPSRSLVDELIEQRRRESAEEFKDG